MWEVDKLILGVESASSSRAICAARAVIAGESSIATRGRLRRVGRATFATPQRAGLRASTEGRELAPAYGAGPRSDLGFWTDESRRRLPECLGRDWPRRAGQGFGRAGPSTSLRTTASPLRITQQYAGLQPLGVAASRSIASFESASTKHLYMSTTVAHAKYRVKGRRATFTTTH